MSLKLEALSAVDGTGIVRAGQILRLVRPPYTLRGSPVLPEESVQDAILRHGFWASQEQFASWEELIDFLNRQVVVARRALGKEIPDSISGEDIVDVASEEDLSVFLACVETDLIPKRMFDHAENFLVAFLASSALNRYPALGSRAAKLLRQTKQARRAAEAAASELASRDLRFPSLERHGEVARSARVAENIIRWRSVFAPAS